MNASTEPVILKLGGSAITDKGAYEGVVKEADLLRIAREVSGFRGKMIVKGYDLIKTKQAPLNSRVPVAR